MYSHVSAIVQGLNGAKGEPGNPGLPGFSGPKGPAVSACVLIKILIADHTYELLLVISTFALISRVHLVQLAQKENR